MFSRFPTSMLLSTSSPRIYLCLALMFSIPRMSGSHTSHVLASALLPHWLACCIHSKTKAIFLECVKS